MDQHYIWLNTDPEMRRHLLRAQAERSAFWRSIFHMLGGAAKKAAAELARRHRERKTVRELAALDTRTLQDIGLEGGDIRSIARALSHQRPLTLEQARKRAEERSVREAVTPEAAAVSEATGPVWLRGVLEGGAAVRGEARADTRHARAARAASERSPAADGKTACCA